MQSIDKTNIATLLLKQKNHFKNDFNVKKVGLFGSFVHSTQTRHSDVDLLVEFNRPIGLLQFARLQLELTDLLQRRVDLVTPKALKPRLKQQVLNEVEWIEGF